MQLRQNQIFAFHYRLERLLGRGGFSEVWLAHDETADVDVAIKIYAPGTGLDNDGVELFRKEFKIVFDMNHSNLLRPNYYSIEDNMPYLVMPYIEHGSTTKMIGKMPETELWKFVRDVASGLAYMHAKEPPVIHQDIKPDNVMLMNDGTYVITDFGISTRARSTLRKSMNVNASAGTQAYMGPERFGKQPAPIKASDVWSLGATLYELMEGDAPFGDFGGINQKSGAEIPDINGNYSDELKELVLACLCQETWDRPTAEQLSDYASDKLRGRNPVMSWKKKGTDGQHENPNGRETQVIINTEQQIAKKNGKDGNAETHGESDKPKRNLAWLWILLVVAILGGVFAFYGNKKKKTDGRQQTELERFDQEQQDADDNIFFQNCKDVADYRSYLNKYPDGLNVELARNKIDKHVADSTAEAERQRQVAEENERKAQEAERQRQIEAENERKAKEAEAERQHQIEAENERKAKEAEAERQRQIEAENERKAKEAARFVNRTFTVNGVSFEMVAVEGGTFTMGATAEQGSDAYDSEKPTHSVTLSSYYMGETEVTQALWQAVMGSNPSWFTGDSQRPVENVSWNDCQTFITKLNQQCAGQLNGRQFRLPTEAEWEYAARGGKKSKGYKYSGSNTLGNVAWYGDNRGNTRDAVGTKQANELGLYDMSGNVGEWCSDWHGIYSSSAQTDPTGPATGSSRVNRGGSWIINARHCRVSFRNFERPDYSNFDLGLRLSLR